VTNMRAFVLTRYGGPDAMELRDVLRPSPGPGEVLIHVYAAGLNPIDFKMREGESHRTGEAHGMRNELQAS
jgi:NADPH:quinone reductase-like Zn-dependent oxidoreductase